MTGHGRGERRAEGVRVTVDVRTVNHRFLDCEVRGALPPDLESDIRARADRRLFRGRVEFHVALELLSGAAALRVNSAAMLALVQALREVAEQSGIHEQIRLEHVAALPWARAVEPVPPELSPAQCEVVLAAVEEALDAAIAVRQREGDMVARDMASRLDAVAHHAAGVRQAASGVVAAHAERLRARVAELTAGADVDPTRLAQEVALLADRGDITEELVRLEAFIGQMRESLAGPGPVGKRLDFTLQEAFREVNTIGSKSRSQVVSSHVIEMKSELERMREQVANVE